MNRHKIIRAALDIPYLAYDNFRTQCFEKWCNEYAFRWALPQRRLTTNDYLYNWYCDQWIKDVENQFYEDFRPYLEKGINDPDTFLELFVKYPKTIEKHYPKAILQTIRKEIKATAYNE
tara:strand:+ start:415 stop:771 length:357 start_codon:yes stop_codon:yes gene_type:complete